jgi:hypothetical protein
LHAFKILRGGGHPGHSATQAREANTTQAPEIEKHRYHSPDTPDYRL